MYLNIDLGNKFENCGVFIGWIRTNYISRNIGFSTNVVLPRRNHGMTDALKLNDSVICFNTKDSSLKEITIGNSEWSLFYRKG